MYVRGNRLSIALVARGSETEAIETFDGTVARLSRATTRQCRVATRCGQVVQIRRTRPRKAKLIKTTYKHTMPTTKNTQAKDTSCQIK